MFLQNLLGLQFQVISVLIQLQYKVRSGTIRSTDFITTNIVATSITIESIDSTQIYSRIKTLETSVATVLIMV